MVIESYFRTQNFIDGLKPLEHVFKSSSVLTNENLIGYLINITINYANLFSNENELTIDELNEFLSTVIKEIIDSKKENSFSLGNDYELKEFVSQLYIKKIIEKGNINEALNEKELQEALYIFLIANLKRYKYHAFNSSFMESIQTYGLNPSFTSYEEVDKINNIFRKYNISNIFGWYDLNSKGTISYSTSLESSYHYGLSSPEWFSQFTGQSYAFNPPSEYNKNAFILGDYDGAKKNLLKLMKESGFKQEDIDYVLDFFETSWNNFANNGPLLAMIPEEFNDNLFRRFFFDSKDIKREIYRIVSRGMIDSQTEEIIDMSDAIYVQLPSYQQLIKSITKTDAIATDKKFEPTKPIVEIQYPLSDGLDGKVHSIVISKATKLQDGTYIVEGYDETLKSNTIINLNLDIESGTWYKVVRTAAEYERLYFLSKSEQAVEATEFVIEALRNKKISNDKDLKKKKKVLIFVDEDNKYYIWNATAAILGLVGNDYLLKEGYYELTMLEKSVFDMYFDVTYQKIKLKKEEISNSSTVTTTEKETEFLSSDKTSEELEVQNNSVYRYYLTIDSSIIEELFNELKRLNPSVEISGKYVQMEQQYVLLFTSIPLDEMNISEKLRKILTDTTYLINDEQYQNFVDNSHQLTFYEDGCHTISGVIANQFVRSLKEKNPYVTISCEEEYFDEFNNSPLVRVYSSIPFEQLDSNIAHFSRGSSLITMDKDGYIGMKKYIVYDIINIGIGDEIRYKKEEEDTIIFQNVSFIENLNNKKQY